jgi:hypothetical protein
MAEPTTPLPGAKADAEDERSVLLGYLDYHRVVLARKAEGITEQEARLPACPPSDLTLLGLIRHMTDVERDWFRRSLTAEGVPPEYGDGDDCFHPPPDATLAGALAAYWEEIRLANANLAVMVMDDTSRGDPGPHSVRRIVVHMIEEYARHCGHADLLRQAIDGVVGD